MLLSQPLITRNSLAVAATAARWGEWDDPEALVALWRHYRGESALVYGEGTNLLITSDLQQLCLHPTQSSVSVRHHGDHVIVIASAGTNWNWLVHYCLANGWWGLENLIGIPGSCGAAPVQNIGAYGAELADCCEWVRCFDWRNGEWLKLTSAKCGFGYRNSLFKAKPWLVITAIALRLDTDTGRWQQMQKSRAHSSLSSLSEQDRADPCRFAAAIATLRAQKLPDPALEPNAGSFFHNPVVDYSAQRELADRLLGRSAAWRVEPNRVKLSAAWLIDQCLGKGYVRGKCALAQNHALCVVNTAGAAGAELLDFATHIQAQVKSRFAVELSIEPKLVGGG